MARKAGAAWLERCLKAIPRGRVSVFGDFCLDAYWDLEPAEHERSIETGRPVRRVRAQRYSPGGAGTIVANLAALGVRRIHAVGLVGDDLFGRCLVELLRGLGVDTSGLLQTQRGWQTLVYAKPHVRGIEQNRLDFGAFNTVSAQSVAALGRALAAAAGASDVVILNQQVPAGVSTRAMITRMNAVVAATPGCRFIVDSRHRAEFYRGCLYKLNAREAARLFEEPIGRADAVALATRLWERTRRPVFVTRGAQGLVAVDQGRAHVLPGIRIRGPTDPVGAGDTALAAIAAALAAGQDVATAARLANLAASITVRKLRTTGTASPAELRRAGRSEGRRRKAEG